MPTSATFPSADATAASPAGGFTLLELIVVLSILGLVTAMTAPAVLQGIASWERQAQVDVLVEQVRGLPSQARGSGRAIEISNAALASDAPPLLAGDGWELSVPTPWRVQANGICETGVLVLRHPSGREHALQVRAPFCDLRVGDQE